MGLRVDAQQLSPRLTRGINAGGRGLVEGCVKLVGVDGGSRARRDGLGGKEARARGDEQTEDNRGDRSFDGENPR